MPLVLSKNPALMSLQPLATEVENNKPPTINSYPPDVEKWRNQVWEQMPPQLKQRPDAAQLLDKALYVINGESGGNDSAVGDGGAAWGLAQSHHIPSGSDSTTQINDMWRLVSNNPAQWTDWGEGALYEGKPFGALGRSPYGGGQAPTGSVAGAALGPQLSKPTINYTKPVDNTTQLDTQGLPAITMPPVGPQIGSSSGGMLSSVVNPTTGGVDAPYGPRDTTYGQDYIDAPSGSPRAALEDLRQGKDQLGNAALAGAVALPIIGAGPIAGPLGAVGQEIGSNIDQAVGAPTVNLPLLGKTGPFSVIGGLAGGIGEGIGPEAAPGRPWANVVKPRPNLRVVQPGERPGGLGIVGNKPDPAEFIKRAREMGMTDDEIRSSFPGALEAASGIDTAPQVTSRLEAEQAAKGAAARRVTNRLKTEQGIEGTATPEIQAEARRAAAQAPENLPAQKPNVPYSEQTAAEMRAANERLRGNGIVDEAAPGQSTGSTLAQEADRLDRMDLPGLSPSDQELGKIAYGARALGDPFTELRTQGEKLLKGQAKSRLQQVIDDEQQGKQHPDQLVPPEQLNMLDEVLGQMSMQDAVTPGPGTLDIPPSTPLKNPGVVQTVKERLAQQEFERSQNVVKQKLQQTTANGMETTPGTGDIVEIAKGIKPDQQASLLNKDWAPGKSMAESAARGISDLISLPRSLQTRFDFSYPFRQGLLFVRRQGEFWDAFGTGLKSFWKDEEWKRGVEQQYMNAPYNPQTLKLTRWTGGNMAQREELFYNRLIDKFPAPLKKVFDASEEAATIFINKLRSDVTNNVARKWLREGLSATDPEFIQDLNIFGNYVNRATGYGNLGELEKSVGLLNTVFYGARRNISMVQAPGYLFNSSGRVRVEAWKDFLGLFGMGSATLGLAQLAGIGEVNTFNPDSADWGKLKIGNTRLDIWGGYQQLARTAYKIADGQIKDPGDFQSFWKNALPFLGNKLSPQAGAAVSTMPEGVKKAIQPVDRPFKITDALAPLAWQGLVQAIKEDGAIAGAIGVTGLFGTGTQTYETQADVRNKAAKELGLGNYEDLTPLQRAKVDQTDAVKQFQEQNASDYRKIKEQRLAPINEAEKQAEDSFTKNQLTKPLPDLWHEQGIQRRQVALDLADQFKDMFDGFDKSKFDKAVEGYYSQEVKNPDGTVDFDATEAKRQDFLKTLPADQQQWIDEALQVNLENKSPLHQRYLKYIDERRKAGYFDVDVNDPQRAKKLRELDLAHPDQDVLNWYWKGGVTGGEPPRLNSLKAVDLAQRVAPNRPIQFATLARPINQSAGSLQAWKDYGERIDSYLTKAVPAYQEQIAKELYDGKTYNQLDNVGKNRVASTILSRVRAGNPELEAALAYFGHSKDANGNYAVSQEAAPVLRAMLAKYGDTPIKPKDQFGPASQFVVRQ